MRQNKTKNILARNYKVILIWVVPDHEGNKEADEQSRLGANQTICEAKIK